MHIWKAGSPPVLFLCWLALLWMAGPPSVEAETIILAADTWCPYNCEAGSDKPGILVEIARSVLGSAGYTVDYRVLPWSRSLSEVRRNRVQGVIGAVRSEAPDLVYGSHPAVLDDTGFAVKKGLGFRYQGPNSLDPYSIAVIADYNYDSGEIDAYLKRNSGSKGRIQFNTGDDVGIANVRKLMAGRVDIVIDSATVLTYIVHKLGLEDQIEIIPLGHPNEIFIAFSPANPHAADWAALLSTGLEELRRQGGMAAILARYGVTDWQKR